MPNVLVPGAIQYNRYGHTSEADNGRKEHAPGTEEIGFYHVSLAEPSDARK